MEITINLRISADDTLTSLFKGLAPAKTAPAKVAKPVEEKEEDLVGDSAPKVSVEELRTTASNLMLKNKAALKEILTKHKVKTVAELSEADYASALDAMKKALK